MGPYQGFSQVDGDEFLSKGMPQPKSFQKTHRYFGIELGFWRMPVRHFLISTGLFLIVFLPLWYVSKGYSSVGKQFMMSFEYNCYGDGSWTFVGINLRFGKFDYGSAKALDLAVRNFPGRFIV